MLFMSEGAGEIKYCKDKNILEIDIFLARVSLSEPGERFMFLDEVLVERPLLVPA